MNDTAYTAYQNALKIVGKGAKAEKQKALFAFKNRNDFEALEGIEAAYQRNNVRSYIRAVKFMPQMFGKKTYHEDDYLAVFAVCSLPDDKAAPMLSDIKQNGAELAVVLEAVKELKTRKPREKRETLKDKLAALVKELDAESVCGAGLEVVCTRRAIADKLRGLLEGA